MSSEVLYRKWRPQRFAELAGQPAVSRTLTNALRSRKVAHAYLFSGPRGTGKTTTGRLLAKAVNCHDLQDGDACNECASCRAYVEGSALDLIELDAASNRGIDEIRSLRDKAQFVAAGGQDARKVYLIDEVHMLTDAAFNALLKTLEEPPEHVIFVLATTEAHKVPQTVVSRCQRFDFRRISVNDVKARLREVADGEQFDVPDDALDRIARVATGSLRDGINLLEQLVDSYGSKLTIENVEEGLGEIVDERSGELARYALLGELKEGLATISEVRDDGYDLRQFQRQVVSFLRGALLAKAGAEPEAGWSDKQRQAMQQLVAELPAERIIAALKALGEADLRADPLSPLPLEMALATAVLQPAAREAASPPPAISPETATPPARKPGAKQQPAREREAPTPPERPKAKKQEPATVEASPSETPSNGTNGTATPDLAAARAKWKAIYDRTRDLEMRAGALLNSGCNIIDVSDSEITFGFRHDMLLQRMQGDGGDNLKALQQAVDEILGAGRTVRVVHDPNVEVETPRRGGHLVKAAEEMGGETLDE